MRSSTQASKVLKQTLAVATTYFAVDSLDDLGSSLSYSWASGNATFSLEATNFSTAEVALNATSTKWQVVPIALPAATGAAGGAFVSWGNLNCARLRLKVVVTVSLVDFEVRGWGVA